MTEGGVSNWLTAIVALGMATLSGIVAYVRAATRNDVEIKNLREVEIKALHEAHAATKDDIETLGRQVGETMQGVRQKVIDTDADLKKVELYVRDNFVRQVDFIQMRTSIEAGMVRMSDQITRMRESLEEKIDRIGSPDQRR